MSQQPPQRQFAEARPLQNGPQFMIEQLPRGNQQFQPLPVPRSLAPYHLALERLLPADQIKAIQTAGQLVVQVVGDTGGVKYPVPQRIVAMAQEAQFDTPVAPMHPAFFYHLGDVVYFYGQADQYYDQFYD